MATVIKARKEEGNIQAMDVCHLIIDKIPGAVKLGFTGTRLVDETHSGQQKFKIRIPGGFNEERLAKIIIDHFKEKKVAIKSFKHLCSESEFKGRRFYISLTLTQAMASIVDGSVIPL